MRSVSSLCRMDKEVDENSGIEKREKLHLLRVAGT